MVLAITATLQGMSVKLRDAEGATLLQKAWGTEQEMPVNVLAFLFCLTLQLNFPRPWVLLQDMCLFLVPHTTSGFCTWDLHIIFTASFRTSTCFLGCWDAGWNKRHNKSLKVSKANLLSDAFIWIFAFQLYLYKFGLSLHATERLHLTKWIPERWIPKRRWRWGNTQRANSNPETHHREGRQLECQGQTWWYSFKRSQSRVQ